MSKITFEEYMEYYEIKARLYDAISELLDYSVAIVINREIPPYRFDGSEYGNPKIEDLYSGEIIYCEGIRPNPKTFGELDFAEKLEKKVNEKEERIIKLKKEKAVLEKALDLAIMKVDCGYLRDFEYCDDCETIELKVCKQKLREYFTEQARKELEVKSETQNQ